MRTLLNLSLGAALAVVPAFGATITTYYAGSINGSLAEFNSSTIVGGDATYVETFDDALYSGFTLTEDGSSPNGFVRSTSGGERKTQVALGLESETIELTGGNLITAVGADFDLTPGGQGQFVSITIDYGIDGIGTDGVVTLTEYLGSTAGNTTGSFFFGFTSDEEFVSFTLSAGNGSGIAESFDYDNLLIEQFVDDGGDPDPEPGGVPEPSTFGLMGLAMVGLGVVRRFRR